MHAQQQISTNLSTQLNATNPPHGRLTNTLYKCIVHHMMMLFEVITRNTTTSSEASNHAQDPPSPIPIPLQLETASSSHITLLHIT